MGGRGGGQWGPRHVVLAILGARVFVPASVALALVLSVGIGINVLIRAGQWPVALVQTPPAVVITGPNVATVSQEIQVAVLGAVQHPGTYALPEGAVARDAVAAAGGLLLTADVSRVRMDALLLDGGVVYVPHQGEVLPVMVDGRLMLNVATADQMHAALGISLTVARRIVAYRAAHGPFTAISQLLLVPLSRAEYDRIKTLVTV